MKEKFETITIAVLENRNKVDAVKEMVSFLCLFITPQHQYHRLQRLIRYFQEYSLNPKPNVHLPLY